MRPHPRPARCARESSEARRSGARVRAHAGAASCNCALSMPRGKPACRGVHSATACRNAMFACRVSSGPFACCPW
eukprot:9216680-Alexandrium_andersonii.AAC.1